jgi:hypothetical protein
MYKSGIFRTITCASLRSSAVKSVILPLNSAQMRSFANEPFFYALICACLRSPSRFGGSSGEPIIGPERHLFDLARLFRLPDFYIYINFYCFVPPAGCFLRDPQKYFLEGPPRKRRKAYANQKSPLTRSGSCAILISTSGGPQDRSRASGEIGRHAGFRFQCRKA